MRAPAAGSTVLKGPLLHLRNVKFRFRISTFLKLLDPVRTSDVELGLPLLLRIYSHVQRDKENKQETELTNVEVAFESRRLSANAIENTYTAHFRGWQRSFDIIS